jgi:hypothetical protein
MMARRLTRRLAAPLLCLSWVGCHGERPGPAPLNPALEASPPAASRLFAGTSSCSGRSCHGGLEPRSGQPIGQDEYSIWITHDKHADAFHVLLNEHSQRIARNLGIRKAHEDARCLSCHLTPFAAAIEGSAAPPASEMARAHEERTFGVGCESCHGVADRWLSTHTAAEWKDYSPQQKRALGMVPISDPAELARACAGCHVGAPPHQKMPLTRDVNHDLIAAGHPRLHFELGVFLANLPPHWNQAAKKKKASKGDEARTWVHGQLASAQAALELLVHRAEDSRRPWPEFAEYDCFACHHDLRGASWRQERGIAAGRQPGSLSWGTWHYTMPRLIADGLPAADADFREALERLERIMRHPAPNRYTVVKHSWSALAGLEKLRTHIGERDTNREVVQNWLIAFGRDDRLTAEMSWDAATQLHLAASVLNETYGDPSIQNALQELAKSLAHPRGFDSPPEFEPAQIEELRRKLKNLGP